MNQIDWDLLLKLRDGIELTDEERDRMGGGNPVLTVKHKKMYSNRGLFSFIDIGNCMGNSSPGEHWMHMQSIRDFISNDPHPMNNVKLYGADYNSFLARTGGCEQILAEPDGGMRIGPFSQATRRAGIK